MATSYIDLENYPEYTEHRNNLSRRFADARKKMNEREVMLKIQLDEMFIENIRRDKIRISEIEQLNNTIEHIRSTLTSNTLTDTGNESIRLIENKIRNLEAEAKKINFHWSTDQLYPSIEQVGNFKLVPAAKFPSSESQKAEITDILSRNVETGQSWYAIDNNWFKLWEKYVGYKSTDTRYSYFSNTSTKSNVIPGPIDNKALLNDGKFKVNNLTEGRDYKLLPEQAWNKLLEWYGLEVGSVEIKVYAVTQNKIAKMSAPPY